MNLSDFMASVKKGTTLVGLDLGDKTIGIAVSDTLWMTATPLKTVFRTKFERDTAEMETLLKGRTLGGLVSGLPRQMNGEEGDRAKITYEMAYRIAEHFNLPVYFQDERLSSSAVERVLIKDLDMSRKKRRNAIDCGAAAFILQGVLDSIRFLK